MKAGSPVYLDMEAYDITNKACNDAVLTYVRAFAQDTARQDVPRRLLRLHAAPAPRRSPPRPTETDLPGNLWYALWDKKNTTTADWPFGPTQYTEPQPRPPVHGQQQGDPRRLHDHRGPRRLGRPGGDRGLSAGGIAGRTTALRAGCRRGGARSPGESLVEWVGREPGHCLPSITARLCAPPHNLLGRPPCTAAVAPRSSSPPRSSPRPPSSPPAETMRIPARRPSSAASGSRSRSWRTG